MVELKLRQMKRHAGFSVTILTSLRLLSKAIIVPSKSDLWQLVDEKNSENSQYDRI